MTKKIITICFAALLTATAYGQEANYGAARELMRQPVRLHRVQPVFLPGSDRFWYTQQSPEGEQYWFVDPKKKEKRLLFDNARFAEELGRLIGMELNPANLAIPGFEFNNDGRSFNLYPGTFKVTYDFVDQRFTGCWPADPETPPHTAKVSPDGRYEIFARGHDLFVRERATGEEKRLTTDGERYRSFATDDEHDAPDEMETRAFWLSDSRRVAYSRPDQRRVGELSLINSLAPVPSVATYKQMMPGDREVIQFDAAVIDVQTGDKVALDIHKWKDQAFDIVYNAPSGDFLYVLRKNRTCDRIELCRADTRTGEVVPIIEEQSTPYLNDQLMQYAFLNGGSDIIWFSERTGWGHLYHYDGRGRLLNAITEGEWMAGQILRTDTARRRIVFEGYGYDKALNPYYKQLFSADIDKTGVKPLTPENANHTAAVSPGGYIVDNYSRVDLPPVCVLRDARGKVLMELSHADIDGWLEAGWRMPEPFTVKAADGETDLYGVMWKPRDFDPSKKYPIITHVYPGPQSENLPLDFHPQGGYNGPLAELGAIVVHFGNRGGSAVRNRAYHTFGYSNLRDYAIEDNKHGLEQLAKRYTWIDTTRVGIFGNSGGGMMTVAAMCRYPDFYKAGVSASGNHDNRIFNRWWGETHHGVSQQTADGDTVFVYTPQENLQIVQNLQGHLMLVTGDMDTVVHPAQTLRLADLLIKYGKNFELVVLPGQGHDFVQQGMTYFQLKMWLHFARYLLGDDSTVVDIGRLGLP